MENNTKKKIGVIALIMVLILCLYFVASTYANYASEVSAESKLSVAKWAVSIGGVDATTEDSFDLSLSPDSEYSAFVSTNKIAPSTSASGDFTIDPTGSEVAMSYVIEVNDADIEYSGSATGVTFEVSGVTVEYVDSSGATIQSTAVSDTYTTYDETTHSGVIGLKDVEAGTYINVTVTVTWESSNTAANNEIDTEYGIEAGTLTIPVTVTAAQYLGA